MIVESEEREAVVALSLDHVTHLGVRKWWRCWSTLCGHALYPPVLELDGLANVTCENCRKVKR